VLLLFREAFLDLAVELLEQLLLLSERLQGLVVSPCLDAVVRVLGSHQVFEDIEGLRVTRNVVPEVWRATALHALHQ